MFYEEIWKIIPKLSLLPLLMWNPVRILSRPTKANIDTRPAKAKIDI